MKPSNVLYSCSMPHSEFATRFNRYAVTTRYMTISSELRTVRNGQKLDDVAANALRRLCYYGGTVTLIQQHRRFQDGSGWYQVAVLRIEVDESSDANSETGQGGIRLRGKRMRQG